MHGLQRNATQHAQTALSRQRLQAGVHSRSPLARDRCWKREPVSAFGSLAARLDPSVGAGLAPPAPAATRREAAGGNAGPYLGVVGERFDERVGGLREQRGRAVGHGGGCSAHQGLAAERSRVALRREGQTSGSAPRTRMGGIAWPGPAEEPPGGGGARLRADPGFGGAFLPCGSPARGPRPGPARGQRPARLPGPRAPRTGRGPGPGPGPAPRGRGGGGLGLGGGPRGPAAAPSNAAPSGRPWPPPSWCRAARRK